MGAAGTGQQQPGDGREHRRPFRPDDHGRMMTPVRESFDLVQIKWPCRLPFVPGFDTTDAVELASEYRS
jgi:hypothetical protein